MATHGGPRPLRRPLVASQDPLVASQDPLGLSLHARPSPLQRTSLSRGRPTAPYEGENPYPEIGRIGPLRGRDLVPGGPCAHGPLRGRDLVPGGCEPHGPLRLSPHRGEQEGSCGARSLRFPHRLTDPRGEGERRPPAGLPNPSGNPSGKQEYRNAKTDEDR